MSRVVRFVVKEVFIDPIYCIYDQVSKEWYKENHQAVSFKKWAEARAYAKRLNQKDYDDGLRFWRTVSGIVSRRVK